MLTLSEIEQQIIALTAQALQIKTQQREENLAKIKALMLEAGLDVYDLDKNLQRPFSIDSDAKKSPSKKVSIKYKGPNGEQWTGRGVPPNWLKNLMEQGYLKEDFLIVNAAQ